MRVPLEGAIASRPIIALVWLTVAGSGCPTNPRQEQLRASESAQTQSRRPTLASLAGRWRASLETPAGELPFFVDIDADEKPPAFVANGAEQIPFSSVALHGRVLRGEFSARAGRLELTLSADLQRMNGKWSREHRGRRKIFSLTLNRGALPRFSPIAARTTAQTSHLPEWMLARIAGKPRPQTAIASFAQRDGLAVGTLSTALGEYRYLSGTSDQGKLRLSHFDGGRAILFQATQRDRGLVGQLWTADNYSAAVHLQPLPDGTNANSIVPHAYNGPRLASDDGRIDLRLPQPTGIITTLQDAQFSGKVVMVEMFATWCTQCKKQLPLVRRLARSHRGRGLEVVGIACERSEDARKDVKRAVALVRRLRLPITLLTASLSDQRQWHVGLGNLNRVQRYPTTIFVGRDGAARRVVSGLHPQAPRLYRQIIEQLLAEQRDIRSVH